MPVRALAGAQQVVKRGHGAAPAAGRAVAERLAEEAAFGMRRQAQGPDDGVGGARHLVQARGTVAASEGRRDIASNQANRFGRPGRFSPQGLRNSSQPSAHATAISPMPNWGSNSSIDFSSRSRPWATLRVWPAIQ